MRILTKLEQKEFDKTFAFLDHYVGCSYMYGARTITDLRFDKLLANAELIKFCNAIGKMNAYYFKTLTEVEKINRIFNNSTAERKEIAMKRLIKYCFDAKVQPRKLRMIGFKSYEIAQKEEPAIYDYAG